MTRIPQTKCKVMPIVFDCILDVESDYSLDVALEGIRLISDRRMSLITYGDDPINTTLSHFVRSKPTVVCCSDIDARNSREHRFDNHVTGYLT